MTASLAELAKRVDDLALQLALLADPSAALAETRKSYAPLASPAFTGNPTAPTATVDDNDTSIASTAFVLGQAGSAAPLIDGTAAAGSSPRYSRQDHVHPTDTSRAPIVAPNFTGTATANKWQSADASASAATGVATTIYTMANQAPAMYLVSANIGSVADAANYSAFAVIAADGATSRQAVTANAALLTITLSGLNIQVTQSSGSTQTVQMTITRIG